MLILLLPGLALGVAILFILRDFNHHRVRRSAPADLDGLSCEQCGYPLLGLEPTGLCPECGTSVQSSIHAASVLPDRRVYTPRIERGLLIVLVANLIALAGPFLVEIDVAWIRGVDRAGWPLVLAGAILNTAGWKLLGAWEPGLADDTAGATSARVVFWMNVSFLLGLLASAVLAWLVWSQVFALALLWTLGVLWASKAILSLRTVQEFAVRFGRSGRLDIAVAVLWLIGVPLGLVHSAFAMSGWLAYTAFVAMTWWRIRSYRRGASLSMKKPPSARALRVTGSVAGADH